MAIKFAPTAPEPKQKPQVQKQKAEKKLISPADPKPRSRGRPSSGKETVTLRVDAQTVAFFKASGDDWREAMCDVLDKARSL